MYKVLSLTLLATFIVFSLAAQTLTKDQEKFLKDNAVMISADTNFSQAEWKAIADQVRDKSIILLGESTTVQRKYFKPETA